MWHTAPTPRGPTVAQRYSDRLLCVNAQPCGLLVLRGAPIALVTLHSHVAVRVGPALENELSYVTLISSRVMQNTCVTVPVSWLVPPRTGAARCRPLATSHALLAQCLLSWTVTKSNSCSRLNARVLEKQRVSSEYFNNFFAAIINGRLPSYGHNKAFRRAAKSTTNNFTTYPKCESLFFFHMQG